LVQADELNGLSGMTKQPNTSRIISTPSRFRMLWAARHRLVPKMLFWAAFQRKDAVVQWSAGIQEGLQGAQVHELRSGTEA
jgi:hypothetical protein